MSKGKFLIEAYKSYDSSKMYNYSDAVDIILKNKRSKINETIEISLNLGVDPRHADQMVRGTVNLPNGSGKKIKVAVFAIDKNAENAKKENALTMNYKLEELMKVLHYLLPVLIVMQNGNNKIY